MTTDALLLEKLIHCDKKMAAYDISSHIEKRGRHQKFEE